MKSCALSLALALLPSLVLGDSVDEALLEHLHDTSALEATLQQLLHPRGTRLSGRAVRQP